VRVIGIVCSPRKGGNTEIMVQEALGAVRESGGETELITVSGKTIHPCDGCYTCRDKGVCHIKDDDMQEIYQKLLESDGIILGTPVYYWNVTAQAKAIMDRTFALRAHHQLEGKVVGAIVVARRIGAGQALSLLYPYFLSHKMRVAGGCIGYGRAKGDVREGEGGPTGSSALEEAKKLGTALVSLYQQLSK